MKAQYAILRFAKYKGPEIGHIESHNERTKEKYASNPDVDTARSHLNFHLVTPQRKYRAEAEKQIAEAGCRTRSDSVRVVEALVTASPEFFKGKKKSEIKAYFQEALDFIREHQDPKTIISAVVHMDEKTPHMHLSFVPLTEDGRLCAKEIVGNKKKLTQWQDKFWKHMVKKYPDLERGESASETRRDHIPPRVFKEMTRLTKQKAKLEELLSDINLFNIKGKTAEIGILLDKYIPSVEQMHTTLKKYNAAFTVTTASDGKTYQVDYYNLDVIISVGYRVKSQRGVQFRIWATGILKEYMRKGFALDDERLKNLGGGGYFKELLERIRASEKVFYRQVLEIYATSIDYDPKAEISIQFFKKVQNKIHYAIHGQTAAEIIYTRADAEKEFMGLTTFAGSQPTLKEAVVAKNYLNEKELRAMGQLVSGYLDFAERQAEREQAMTMQDWSEHLDRILTMSGEQLLIGNGSVSHKQAIDKATGEYRKYKARTLSEVERDYLDSIKLLEQKTDKK